MKIKIKIKRKLDTLSAIVSVLFGLSLVFDPGPFSKWFIIMIGLHCLISGLKELNELSSGE